LEKNNSRELEILLKLKSKLTETKKETENYSSQLELERENVANLKTENAYFQEVMTQLLKD
jgi:hypothetical protein